MPSGKPDDRTLDIKSIPVIKRLEMKAENAHNRLASGQCLTMQELHGALDALLAVKDVALLNVIFRQLPPAALSQPEIAFSLLRFLFLSGNRKQTLSIIADLEKSGMDYKDENYLRILQRINEFPPHLPFLETPEVVDYQFTLADSHYSMRMALHCSACDGEYLETTGWGIMILRPTCCTTCLTPRLISPDFLFETMQKYHTHDGHTGFRQTDHQLRQLVARWHQQISYPSDGYYHEVDLGDLLALPIQRTLVNDMYNGRFVKTPGDQV